MSTSIKRVTSVLSAGLAALSSLASADQVENPLRLRFNTDVLTMLFEKGDQRMLDAFEGLKISPKEDGMKCQGLDNATFSVETAEGIDRELYDFDVSVNDETKGYLGFEGKDLRVVGTATFTGGEEVSFSAPIDQFKIEAEFIPEDNTEVTSINKKAMKPTVKDFTLEVAPLVVTGEGTLTPECATELHEGLIDGLMETYDSIWNGDLNSLSAMPVESFLPMILIRHVGGFAVEQDITSDAITFGFDPEMIFERVRPTPSKKQSMLKEISSTFTEQSPEDDPFMLQFIIDENAINSFLLEFVLVDRAFSIREFIRVDPRLADLVSQMNTQSLEVILPQVVEEYGRGKNIDFYISLSHSLVGKKLEGVKPSGFQMDKNGNFRFVFNVSITLLVEKENGRKDWEEARSMFASFQAKGKITTNTSNKRGERLVSLLPKSAEISQLKIYNKDDEEQELESMLITSGFNVQMDQLFKVVKPLDMPMKNLPTPPEMECLGFALSDLNLNFKKGYVEVTCGYKKVDQPRKPEVCEGFIEALKKGPQKAKDSVDNLFGGRSAKEFIQESQDKFNDEYNKLKADKDGSKDAEIGDGEEQVIVTEL